MPCTLWEQKDNSGPFAAVTFSPPSPRLFPLLPQPSLRPAGVQTVNLGSKKPIKSKQNLQRCPTGSQLEPGCVYRSRDASSRGFEVSR